MHKSTNFLKASAGIEFSGGSRIEVYSWVEEMLVAQITRVIRAYACNGRVQPKAYRRHRFASRYTPTDTACWRK